MYKGDTDGDESENVDRSWNGLTAILRTLTLLQKWGRTIEGDYARELTSSLQFGKICDVFMMYYLLANWT